jgi:hypothetical protein
VRNIAWALFGLSVLVAAALAIFDAAGGITVYIGAERVSESDRERVVDPDPDCVEDRNCAQIWNPGTDVAFDVILIGAGLAIAAILLSGLIWIATQRHAPDF